MYYWVFLQNTNTIYSGEALAYPFAETKVFYAPIKEWRCLAKEKEGFKAVYEVSFNIGVIHCIYVI